MMLNFATSITGVDDEGIEFAERNHAAILSISEMLAPTFLGMIKSEMRRSGIVADVDKTEVAASYDGKVG